MGQDFLAKFTNLGDPPVLLLGGLGVFLYLWSDDERRTLARSWAVAFGLCVLLTIVGKLVFHLVRWNENNAFRLLSPSGHVAIGTGFYGCCAAMLTWRRSRAVQVLVWVGTALLLGMLAASRLMMGLHSVPEIIVAFAIGGCSLVVFTLRADNGRPNPLNAGQLVSLICLIFVAHYMPRVKGEAMIIYVVQEIGR